MIIKLLPKFGRKIEKRGGKVIDLSILTGKKATLVSLASTVHAFDVELVECFRNNVLLVSQLSTSAGSAQLQIGQNFQIRFKINNVIYSYHTKIVRYCNNTDLCLQLLVPGESNPDALSRELRVKVDKKDIKITLQDGLQKIPVFVEDISVNGARLVADIRLGKINQEFNIELTIKEGANSIRLPCKIRYVRTECDSTSQGKNVRFHHGVEFLHLADNAENFLLRFVS